MRGVLAIALGTLMCAPIAAVGQGPAGGPAAALGGFRLLGHQTVVATTVNLVPSDPTVQQTVSGPTILDVQIPPDARRTNVVLLVNDSISWHQVVTSSPFNSSIGMRVFIASSALPAPGSFEALSMFAGADSAAGVSSEDRVRSLGWQPRYALDHDLLRINLEFAYPALTPSELDTLATAVMQSDMEFTLQPEATIQSVSNVTFGRIRSLQVWGD